MEFFITLISLSLSLIAAFISSATLWLTLLKRGRLICLRPQSFNIGRYSSRDTSAPYQILLRQLFIATTGPKLFFIEQLYIELRRSTSVQQFNIWVYGKQKDLVREIASVTLIFMWGEIFYLVCCRYIIGIENR